MNLKEYIQKEKERIERFEKHWIEEREKMPNYYPEELDSESDWFEQYIVFEDIEGKNNLK